MGKKKEAKKHIITDEQLYNLAACCSVLARQMWEGRTLLARREGSPEVLEFKSFDCEDNQIGELSATPVRKAGKDVLYFFYDMADSGDDDLDGAFEGVVGTLVPEMICGLLHP